MNDDRLQILKMVQEGKVSPEEAAKLLDAMEQPRDPASGPKPTHVRVKVIDGAKTVNFSVGVGLARWVLNVAGSLAVTHTGHQIDKETLLELIDRGGIGKIFEVVEGRQRVEVYLEP